MKVNLTNGSNSALQRLRDSFASQDFEPGRKRIVNALLRIFSLNWEELIKNVDWRAAHRYPINPLELKKLAEENLKTLMAHIVHIKQEQPERFPIEVSHDQVVNCIIDYASLKFDDVDFRDDISEFLLAEEKKPEKLLLLHLPTQLYTKVEISAKKKEKETETYLSDLLNDKIPNALQTQLQLWAKPAVPVLRETTAAKAESISPASARANKPKFVALEVKEAVKTDLSHLRPFAASIVNVIEALHEEVTRSTQSK